MTAEEYTHIYVSLLNKKKLDGFKLLKKESYNSVLGELIIFGEENGFKDIRIKKLTKKLYQEKEINANIKIKQKASSQIG